MTFHHDICTGLINALPCLCFESERSGKLIVLFLVWQLWQFFEGLPLVLKRKIVEYSATQSLNHWTSNFHFQQMNTEEFIDFKIHCYLSANLISPCSFNTWPRRRNARVNIKGHIKPPPPFCHFQICFARCWCGFQIQMSIFESGFQAKWSNCRWRYLLCKPKFMARCAGRKDCENVLSNGHWGKIPDLSYITEI